MGHESQGNGGADERSSSVRTERAGSCGEDTHMQSADKSADCRSPRTEHSESDATPGTASGVPPLGKGGVHREFTAHLFKNARLRRWENDEGWASGRAVAEKCGVSESIVRRWETGEKAIPMWIVRVLPPAFGRELARGLLVDRGGLQLPLVALRESLDRLDAPITSDRRADTIRALREARDRINARLDRLTEDGT